MILRWALHFASGNSLFTGILVILSVWAAITFTRFRRYERVVRLAILMGVLLIVLSATPFPWWAYAIWLTTLCLWMWAHRRVSPEDRQSQRIANLTAGVLVVSSLIAAGVELMTLFPRSPPANHDVMYVIGDSITAGLNEDDLLWPTIMAESKHVDVVNLAQPGAMADSAIKQATLIPTDADGIVLIEIGGNDLLSGRSSAAYGHDLKQLIDTVTAPNRTLVMMELPLAPFANNYGRVQRRLTRQYDIVLISKRDFAEVLGMSNGTLDGIHLSYQGQHLMAEIIWRYVGPLFAKTRAPLAAK